MESVSEFIGLVSFPTPAFTTELIPTLLFQLSHHNRCLLHFWWPQSPGSPYSPPSSLSLVSISSLRCLPSILTAQPRLSTAKLKGIHFASLSKKKPITVCAFLWLSLFQHSRCFIASLLAPTYHTPARATQTRTRAHTRLRARLWEQ